MTNITPEQMRELADYSPEPVDEIRYIGAVRSALRAAANQLEAVPSPEQVESLRQLACEGHGTCRSPLHVHGCYADDGTACDEPDEHLTADPAPQETGVL